MESLTNEVSSKSSNDKKAACPRCPLPKSKISIRFEFGESTEDMCDRCDFVNQVVKRCVTNGLLANSGTSQEWEWQDIDSYPGQYDRGSSWSGFKWFIHNEYRGYRDSRFELFTLPGLPKPFPELPVKRICETTASPESLAKVQEWLETCRSSHTSCFSQNLGRTLLPKRVLDVSLPVIRLYETRNEPGRYTCLSHCWGATRPPCRTTSATVDANQSGIEWDALPATFQDAIDFTRRLGLQYIWIDSVCIIQDDIRDWIEQSALMANIYENAYVTLCATASSSDDGGCYSSAPLQLKPSQIFARKSDGTEYEVYVRHQLDERHIPSWHLATQGTSPQSFPLMTRAWAYQERLLSPRLVHFTAGEIMWECSELSACECCQSGIRGQSLYLEDHGEKKDYREAQNRSKLRTVEGDGNNIAFAFSSLDLSFEKDKLPAISGIAKQMLRLRPGDTYLAGLWKKSILADLRWLFPKSDGRRPSVWRSPSWSWMSLSWTSLDGAIEHQHSNKNSHDYCSCIDVSVTPSDPDPTGELSSGYIVLSAPVIQAQLRGASLFSNMTNRYVLRANGFRTHFRPDSGNDFRDESLAIGDLLLCLRLGTCQNDKDLCLVLKQRGGDESSPVYERVGCLIHETKVLEDRWFTPGMENTLVKIV